MFATPFALAAGVYVRLPLASIAGGVRNSPGFVSTVTLNVSVWALSSAGPLLMAVAHAALYASSSFDVTLPPEVNVGSSLTGSTVMVNVTGSDRLSFGETFDPSSESSTVMSELPFRSALSVNERLPEASIVGPVANRLG